MSVITIAHATNGYADWRRPNHWKPAGRFCTHAPSVHHRSASLKATIVASVTTMEGIRRYATRLPFSAPSAAPAAHDSSAATATEPVAFAATPATTPQIANRD